MYKCFSNADKNGNDSSGNIKKKERLHKKARGRYQTFATTEKEEKGQYGRERYKNLSEY